MSQRVEPFLNNLKNTDASANLNDSSSNTNVLHEQYISMIMVHDGKPQGQGQSSPRHLTFTPNDYFGTGKTVEETCPPLTPDVPHTSLPVERTHNKFGPAVDQPIEDNMLKYATQDFEKISHCSGSIANVQELDTYIKDNRSTLSNNELTGLQYFADNFNSIQDSSKLMGGFLQGNTGVSLKDLSSYVRLQQMHRETFE